MISTEKIPLVFAIALILAGSVAHGQEANDIELTRSAIAADRQAIVAANLGLTNEEGQRFWPLYRDYRNDLAKIGDRAVKLISTYAENYENLPETTAEWMVTEFVEIAKAKAETQERWIPRLREVLPPVKLARFFQIENKLDAVVNYDLADSIPLIQ